MALADLNDYYYFVHVVEKGGFSRAADVLGIPKSRLSRHIGQLERRLDAVLIQRTTRQFRVTELGEVFYQHARSAIEHVELAEAALKRKQNKLTGTVTISCSLGLAQFALKELLVQFMVDYPEVTVRQQVTNLTVDLVAAGVDMCIRGHTDALPDSTLIARPLARVEWHLFASPDLVSDSIQALADLHEHPLLALGWQQTTHDLKLVHTSGATEVIPNIARFKSEDMATLKEAAMSGLGIVALPAYVCWREVANASLVRVLPQWHAGEASLSLLMPRRGGYSAPVAALRGFLEEALADYVDR
ncbi:MAG: LysR family transcriptional regulator [Pseudomonadales bacterium]|nr:LysR family transcriptional regulator [Pseudomonadales bacterium]MBO7005031.1 LysR family transcriptional regulator [Pseudomonadales bacterium]